MQQLKQIAILADEINETDKAIYSQPGLLSLKEFLKLKQKLDPNYSLDPNIAVSLFYTCLDFVFFLDSHNCYHNDIKPDNIIIVNLENTSNNENGYDNDNDIDNDNDEHGYGYGYENNYGYGYYYYGNDYYNDND